MGDFNLLDAIRRRIDDVNLNLNCHDQHVDQHFSFCHCEPDGMLSRSKCSYTQRPVDNEFFDDTRVLRNVVCFTGHLHLLGG